MNRIRREGRLNGEKGKKGSEEDENKRDRI
jgi:hypothetical protein